MPERVVEELEGVARRLRDYVRVHTVVEPHTARADAAAGQRERRERASERRGRGVRARHHDPAAPRHRRGSGPALGDGLDLAAEAAPERAIARAVRRGDRSVA